MSTEWQIVRHRGKYRMNRLHMAWHVLRGRPLAYRLHFQRLHIGLGDKHTWVNQCWAGPVSAGEEAVSAREELAAAFYAAVRAIPIRLGPNSLEMAQRGTPIVLTGSEADQFVDAAISAVSAYVSAEKAAAWQEGHTDADCWIEGHCYDHPNPYRETSTGRNWSSEPTARELGIADPPQLGPEDYDQLD